MAHRSRTPESVHDLLAEVPAADRETLELRVERWWPDLLGALTTLYPERDV